MAGVARITVVVPFLNAIGYLRKTAPMVVQAARGAGGVEILYVDNGSTDGSAEYVSTLAPDVIRVLHRPGDTIARMRNEGARASAGEFLSFLDADCGVRPGYFEAAVDVLRTSGASATGCEYHLPEDPRWIERTLHDLHYMGRDRDVVYINAGNFFITRAAFDAVGGFREDLRTGEDADIGQRLTVAGIRIREAPRVEALHYGNPKTLGVYYRRTVWHGLGMFATVTRHRLDRPTVMLGVHLLLTLAGLGAIAAPWGWPAFVLAAALQLVVPAVTVAFRILQTRRVGNVPAALLLYWLYYWARAQALFLVAIGRDGYSK